MNQRISVIVATRNRPRKIVDCISSILSNSYKYFEVIIVDQSSDERTSRFIKELRNPLISYFKMDVVGLDKARNLGLSKARGEIVTYLDDDCVVPRDWLSRIAKTFESYPGVSVLMSQVLPYKPRQHQDLRCHGVIKFKKKRVFKKPPKKKFIFSGNALSFRRRVFNEIGGFKEWLGVGSVGHAGEDEEFVYRSLKAGVKVMVNPEIRIYHNRWMAEEDRAKLLIKYTGGVFAAFGFHAFRGDPIAWSYLKDILKKRLKEWKRELSFFIKNVHPRLLFRYIKERAGYEVFYYARGLLIGLYYAFKEQ